METSRKINAEVKVYESTKEGKALFTKEVISPLLKQADTGWHGAEYEIDRCSCEWVWLLNADGARCSKVCVNCDSCQAMIRDVFRSL